MCQVARWHGGREDDGQLEVPGRRRQGWGVSPGWSSRTRRPAAVGRTPPTAESAGRRSRTSAGSCGSAGSSGGTGPSASRRAPGSGEWASAADSHL